MINRLHPRPEGGHHVLDTLHVRSREDLATLLAKQIAAGHYQPGDLLPSERALSDAHGLSRSMVREALRMLAERRLIEILPGRGSRVRAATVADAIDRLIEIFDHTRVTPRNLIEARSMIEATAAGLAAERAGEEELEAIGLASKSCARAVSLLDKIRWDLTFHLAIAKAAGNPLVETMFHAIQPYIVELLIRSLTDPTVSSQGLALHERIFHAIVGHDGVLASREMAAHLSLGIELFGPDLDRNLNLVARDALGQLASSEVTFEDVLHLARSS
jgi:GntR family transcriptional regulator, transcriptional repressor for pyruvate dehydrogenase complex